MHGWPESNRLACRWGIRTADNFLATPAYQNPPRKRAARRAGLGQADLPPLAWVDRTRHFFAHAACTPKSVSAPSCGRSLAERQRGLAPAYTGETPPYGTLCPCRCVKLWTNAPASMNTCCKAARTGCGPAGGFPPASFQGSAPRHIKAAALTRCVAAHSYLRCFCISSTLGFFVTFTVRIIATARRTPLVGDLERMPALFIFVQGFFGGTSVMYLHLHPQKGTSS